MAAGKPPVAGFGNIVACARFFWFHQDSNTSALNPPEPGQQGMFAIFAYLWPMRSVRLLRLGRWDLSLCGIVPRRLIAWSRLLGCAILFFSGLVGVGGNEGRRFFFVVLGRFGFCDFLILKLLSSIRRPLPF